MTSSCARTSSVVAFFFPLNVLLRHSFALHTLSHHCLTLFLAFSTFFGLTSYLSFLCLFLLHELSWLALILVFKLLAVVSGKRCGVWKRLARNSLGTVVWMVVCFL